MTNHIDYKIDTNRQADLSLKKISLSFFRSYQTLRLENPAQFTVFVGENGAGKTNILEAISLLSPGRGLRGAKLTDIQNIHHPAPLWAASFELQTDSGLCRIGTSFTRAPKDNGDLLEKRIVKIDGTITPQNRLSDYLSVIWLTPQMDGLFLDSKSARRRFFDRFVQNLNSNHAQLLTSYENSLRQRSRILKDSLKSGKIDNTWLSALEKNMAETAVAIAANRLNHQDKLNEALKRLEPVRQCFPLLEIAITGDTEHHLSNTSAIETEDYLRDSLSNSRAIDAITGGAACGAHKSDLDIIHLDKSMPANQCSTGEQKAMLVSLVLGQATLIHAEKNVPPLILLDDIASHFDYKRQQDLFSYLKFINAPCFMTGVQKSAFKSLYNDADFYHVSQAQIKKIDTL